MDGKHEKQGYLGNMHSKTLPQLRELLQGQEKLLAKQKFLDSLPDKGEKVQHFAEMLRELILEKEKCEKQGIFPPPMAEAAPAAARRQGLFSEPKEHQEVSQESYSDFVMLRDTHPPPGLVEDEIERNVQEKVPANAGATTFDVTEALSEHLQSLSVGSKEDSLITRQQDCEHFAHGAQKFQNSYEKVIKKGDHVDRSKRKEPFKLNRTLKVSSIKDLSGDFFTVKSKTSQIGEHNKLSSPVTETGAPHRFCGQEMRLREKPPEESAAREPFYRFDKTKMIPIEDSIEIQRRQKEEMERLQALHAAERLAERLCIRMEEYNTSMPDMDYREDLGRDNDGEVEDSDDDPDDGAT